jgi:hypothetical protein
MQYSQHFQMQRNLLSICFLFHMMERELAFSSLNMSVSWSCCPAALAASARKLPEAGLRRTDTAGEVSSAELRRSTEDGLEVAGSEDVQVKILVR